MASPVHSPRHSIENDAAFAAQLAASEPGQKVAAVDNAPSMLVEDQVHDVAQERIANANQDRVAHEEEHRGQEGIVDDAWAWLNHASAGIDQFVVDYPLPALVMAVVCGIFGISQILPSFLAALLTGVPLCYFSYRIYKAATTRWPEFSRALAAEAANGVGSNMAIRQANQAAEQFMAGGFQQPRGVVRNGYVPGGISLHSN